MHDENNIDDKARNAMNIFFIVDCHVALFIKQNYGLLGLELREFESELPGRDGVFVLFESEPDGRLGRDFSVDSE